MISERVTHVTSWRGADAPSRALRAVRQRNRVQRRTDGVSGPSGREGNRFRHGLARDHTVRSLRRLRGLLNLELQTVIGNEYLAFETPSHFGDEVHIFRRRVDMGEDDTTYTCLASDACHA